MGGYEVGGKIEDIIEWIIVVYYGICFCLNLVEIGYCYVFKNGRFWSWMIFYGR